MILRWKFRLVQRWLISMNHMANHRIALGDFDFDDTIYRTRDATAVLLEIYWSETDELD